MKIYFAGSIRGGREDKEIYLEIINYLRRYGEVLTEHIGDNNLSGLGELSRTDKFIYDRDIKWLNDSDVIVAEVTNPSLGVGYEIGKAEGLNKRILCLFRNREDRKLSAMISGNDNVSVKEYSSLNEAFEQIDNYFSMMPKI